MSTNNKDTLLPFELRQNVLNASHFKDQLKKSHCPPLQTHGLPKFI